MIGLCFYFEFFFFIEAKYRYDKHTTIIKIEQVTVSFIDTLKINKKIGTKKIPPPIPIFY